MTLNWDFYLRFLSRTFDGFSGLGKNFYVNGTQIFTSEMHPRSGIQALYDSKGNVHIIRLKKTDLLLVFKCCNIIRLSGT